MIQVTTHLEVADNSGARIVKCIKVLGGSRRKYAALGDIIVVSIKEAIQNGSERGIHGGVWPAPPQAPSFVQLFVEVDDCDAYVEQAGALGATVLIPPQALPDGDTMAVLRDPCGMTFGIVRPGSL